MRYVKLFPSVPDVSSLCLGTASFGSAISREDSFAQMGRFYEHGGNFFDSARVYADWLPNGHGASEKTLGAWIRERRCRDKVVVSTKGAHPDLKTMNVPRMSKAELRFDLDESLLALGIDYIDVYFLHRDDASRPVEEILENLEAFRKEGKIRHYSYSNWKLSRMEEAEKAAASHGLSGFACNQIRFGLGDLNANEIGDKTLVPMDKEIYSWHGKIKKPLMAYTSSCNGYFSKKLKGMPVAESQEKVYNNPSNQKLLEKLSQWEKDCKAEAAVLVSAYVMAQDFPSVPISSFSALEQLEELIHASKFDFEQEMLNEIQDIKRFLWRN